MVAGTVADMTTDTTSEHLTGRVAAVSLSPRHRFSKTGQFSIRLLAGLGVEGDAHAGTTVQHLSRRRFHPEAPNLRQVHLFASEMLDVLRDLGFQVAPGDLGENITSEGLDLLALPTRTRLRIGPQAVLEVTGLRNPCAQLDGFAPGLMEALLERRPDGGIIRKAGIMAVVLADGEVRAGDNIEIVLPDGAPESLRPV